MQIMACIIGLCKWVAAAAAVVMMVSMVTSCGNDAPAAGPPATGPYKVVCTVAMVTDITREVAGDRATVTGLLGEGIDPHLYKPTRDDIAALKSAHVVFYSGLLLEGKMTEVLDNVGAGGKPVVPVTKGIPLEKLITPHGGGHHDPHVWMDVALWSDCVGTVADTLAAFDPAHAAEYRERAEKYRKELESLNAYARRAVATIPEKGRVVVTSHDAFSYFGRAYGLEVRGIQGISTETEAGLRDLEQLVDFIVTRKIGAVFVETSVSEKNVTALLEGARAKGHTVTIGGVLFSDAMGTAGTHEGTYFGMIDHNVTTVVRALGGEAPEKGFQGKLTGVKH